MVFPSAFEFDVMVGASGLSSQGKLWQKLVLHQVWTVYWMDTLNVYISVSDVVIHVFFFFFFLSPEYRHASLSKIAMQKYDDDDVSPDMMPKVKPFNF